MIIEIENIIELIQASIIIYTFADPFGTIAQLVEQRTENPCVAGSIPAGTTGTEKRNRSRVKFLFFCFYPSLRNQSSKTQSISFDQRLRILISSLRSITSSA